MDATGRTVLTLALLCGASAASVRAATKAEAAVAPAAATVNGIPILVSEVEAALRQARQADQVPEDQVAQLRGVILDQLIAVEVVTQVADKAGVQATDAEIESLLVELRRQAGGDEAIRAAWGLGIPEIKLQIARGIKAQHYLDQTVGPQVAVSDEQVKAFYDENPLHFAVPEQVHVSHILCMAERSEAEKRAAAKLRCEALLARVKGGEDFAAVATAASDCPSKEQGGDLNWLRRGQMLPGFEEAALALKDGEMAPALVETDVGYHIIKLTGRKPEGKRPLDEVKDQIRQFLLFNQRTEKEQAHVAALIGAAKVERAP